MTRDTPFRISARQRAALAALLVAASTFVLFGGALNNDFIGWDDEFYVLANPYITPLTGLTVWKMFSNFHFKSWTPLTLLSHAIDYSIWGLDPRGHHLTNMVIHSLNAVWMLLLAMGLLKSYMRTPEAPGAGERAPLPDGALLAGGVAAALLFAWHPIRVESVACASSRKDLLCTFFTLPALLFYLSYARRRGMAGSVRPYLASISLFAIALLAKGSVMTLPGILILIDCMQGGIAGGWGRWKRLILEKVPFMILGAASACVAYIASEGGGTMAQALRAKSEFSSIELGVFNIAFYPVRMLWPAELAELYSYPHLGPFLLFSSITPAVTLVCGYLWWKGRRSWMYAWCAYVIALLPMAGFIPSMIQVIANRYAYFAAAPFTILAGGGIAWAWAGESFRKRVWALPALVAGVCGVLTLLAVRTVAHIPDWRDAETVWRHTIEVSPGAPLAHNELGLALLEKKEYRGAIASFQRSVELSPGFSEALCNMGGAFLSMGDTSNAEGVLRAALAMSPRDDATLTNLGNVRLVEKRYSEAEEYFRRAQSFNPASSVAAYDLGYALMLDGKTDEALAELRRAIVSNPNYANAYYMIGGILSARKDGGPAALEAYRNAARLGNGESRRILLARGLTW